MESSIDVHVEFSFRGEDYSLSASVNLDEHMPVDSSGFFQILAHMNDVDTYSYLYEVMEESELEFDNPQGLAAEYFSEGRLDLSGLANRILEERILERVGPLAIRETGIDPAQNAGLRRLLLEVWHLAVDHE
ncbi:MAG: hypothetical protein HKL98_10745 [Burkholderiales bacterium]|nr:hypothetical protein [Burkholderiales bacterium]